TSTVATARTAASGPGSAWRSSRSSPRRWTVRSPSSSGPAAARPSSFGCRAGPRLAPEPPEDEPAREEGDLDEGDGESVQDRHAGECRHRRLDEDGREDRPRRPLTAEALERRDSRRRRPDAAGDVLGEHRDHLCLQSHAVPDLDLEAGEDPHPAEDEDEVV